MPEILRKNIDHDTLYAIWQITEETGQLRAAINLGKEEAALYGQFVAEIRKKQWLAYHLLLKDLLDGEEWPVAYDPSGRPFLVGRNEHLSVTHSGDLVAVMISRKGRVGIDIEKVKPRVRNITDRYLSPEEIAMIGGNHDLELLTLAWCAKEAIYKMIGIKTLDFREQIRLEMPSRPGLPFRASIRLEGNVQLYQLFSETVGDYILAYVLE